MRSSVHLTFQVKILIVVWVRRNKRNEEKTRFKEKEETNNAVTDANSSKREKKYVSLTPDNQWISSITESINKKKGFLFATGNVVSKTR